MLEHAGASADVRDMSVHPSGRPTSRKRKPEAAAPKALAPWDERGPWWVWASLTPLGLGAWAPIVPGRELRRWPWVAGGVLWTLVALAGWVLAVANDGGSEAGWLLIIGWSGGTITTLNIRFRYLARVSSASFVHARRTAEQRLHERREAQRLAVERPNLALELGVGRPDVRGARHAGLVDVNNAPLEALLELPGIDTALAERLLDVREEIDGFSSVDDLGHVLELDGHLVERLKDRAVCLPR